MLDFLRTRLHSAITSPTLDGFAPVRVPKDLARRLNATLGQPICSKEELEARRAARAKLAALRGAAGTTKIAREAAPVTVYFEKDRSARELGRIKETLDARKIAYKELDVAGDDTTMEFVCRTAKVKSDELPVVFVGPVPVGRFADLVRMDASGELVKAVFGA
jgi:glutaredoxin